MSKADDVHLVAVLEARVAAFRVSDPGPLVLLAGHRPAGSILPVYEVPDLEQAVETLRKRGWRELAGALRHPQRGLLHVPRPHGNEDAIFEDMRPGAMEGAAPS